MPSRPARPKNPRRRAPSARPAASARAASGEPRFPGGRAAFSRWVEERGLVASRTALNILRLLRGTCHPRAALQVARLGSTHVVRRFKETAPLRRGVRLAFASSFSFFSFVPSMTGQPRNSALRARLVARARQAKLFLFPSPDRRERQTTLSGGSLGSCVDEERSQLRELM